MKTRKWNEQQLRVAAENSLSIRQVLKRLKLKEAGGNYSQIKKYLAEYKIDTSHFHGQKWNKGKSGTGINRIELDKILTTNSSFQSHKLKKRLFAVGLKFPKCEICGWNQKSIDGRIPVELDHINGDHRDNRLDNIRILCPNCHSLQSTHRGRNINQKKS